MYTVVFEYKQNMGGMYGVRTSVTYNSKAQFHRLHKPNDYETVIAEGITHAEADCLTYATPEICRLAGAVEQADQDSGGHMSEGLLEHEWLSALEAIHLCRTFNYSTSTGVVPDAKDYIQSLRASATSDSKKDQIFRLILKSMVSEKSGLLYLDQYPSLLDQAKAILEDTHFNSTILD